MQDRDKKKICIVTQSLGGGGAERSTAQLSQLLDALGHEVHLISILRRVDYEYAGTLHNLGVMKDADDSFLGRIKRFLFFRRLMNRNRFDLIIDNRPRGGSIRELMFYLFLYDLSKTVFVVRSSKLATYFPNWHWMIGLFYGKAKKIVCVSQEIAAKVKENYKLENVTSIYNPVFEMAVTKVFDLGAPYILSYGRFDEAVKNHSLLLEAYARSILIKNGIKLLVLGEGPDENYLRQKVCELGLKDHVVFERFAHNPAQIIKNAHFVTLTSRYEGFPRVLVEALSLGVPVVSVDCSSGPKEIVINEKNGLLVENHNPKKLAAAFDRMINDGTLYSEMKKNAASSVAHLQPERIAGQWQKLILSHE